MSGRGERICVPADVFWLATSHGGVARTVGRRPSGDGGRDDDR